MNGPPSIYQLPELYDAQYRHYLDDIPFYLRLAGDQGGPILELGSGTGRVTAALGRAGHVVVGVEASEAMRRRGLSYLQSEALAERVTLVPADMRDLDLGRTFPLIVAPFNTFCHLHTLSDQDDALNSVRRHLDPGGAFALDLFMPHFGPLDVLRREPIWNRDGGTNSELFLVQHHTPEAQLIESRYYLDTVDPHGRVTRTTAILRQRYYTRLELERALVRAGLARVSFFGGFDRRPLTRQSDLMAVIARPE